MLSIFIRTYDFLYRLFRGLLGEDARAGAALLIELRSYRGGSRVLRDGAEIRRGDVVGVIHLNNSYVSALHKRAKEIPEGVKQKLRFDIIASYGVIVKNLSGPRYRNVVAFMGSTIFAKEEAETFSFEFVALPDTLVNRVESFYARMLVRVFHPRGNRRAVELRGRRVAELWISRAEMRRLYGVDEAGY